MKSVSAFLLFLFAPVMAAQRPGGTIRGVVRIEPSGAAVRRALVRVVELGQTALTDEGGAFLIEGIPPGRYHLIAHLDRLPDVIKTVEVTGGEQVVEFRLSLAPITEQVTVTAAGSAEAIASAYQSVVAVGALELAQTNPISIGEALEDQLGIAKRSFGPGSGRPVIRGFDGDRVLVLQDGLRLGGIASQSGDEVEPLDVLALDRVEIVKGPATLLYGSNAIGGVVNGISANEAYQPGLSGYLTALGGTNGRQGGTSGGLKYGTKGLFFFANGSAQKIDDYRTPQGAVLNSYARAGGGTVGVGWFPRRGWLWGSYAYDYRRHGIPAEPGEVDLEFLKERRHGYQLRGGLRDLGGFFADANFALGYSDYRAREFEFESDEQEIEPEGLATNRVFDYRLDLHHRRRGRLSGALGLSGFVRTFVSIGAEAPAPRTRQNSVAVYALERIEGERIGIQLGGRLERNGYEPEGNLPKRNFIGLSGSAGLRFQLWKGIALVANYQHSFRAPALEELYNNGPHPGLLVFDIGNPNLKAERGDGVDLSLRREVGRARFTASFFYYRLGDFVFPAFTGVVDEDSGLPVVNYAQGDSRYVGGEARLDVRVARSTWLTAQADYTRAELLADGKPLPRIPPLRARLGLAWQRGALSINPELVIADRQERVFDNEAPTAGYAVFDLRAAYAFMTGRIGHLLSFRAHNLADVLYRNHLSFLKEFAPEMGRNFRLNYSLRF